MKGMLVSIVVLLGMAGSVCVEYFNMNRLWLLSLLPMTFLAFVVDRIEDKYLGALK